VTSDGKISLHVEKDTIAKVARGRRPVTARLVIRVAQLIEVGVDDLLAGQHLSSRVCPHCGHPPDDFADEETVVTDARETQEIKGNRHAG
jgi:hypothetical protein